MRLVIFGFAILLVFLPSILILFAAGSSLRARIPWAILAFASPIIMIALVQLVPALTNNTPGAQQWERFLGLVLSGSGFILPWVFFVLFLHHDKRGKAKPGR